MVLFLTILSGIAWTVVYIEAIRLGFRDRSYAIPVAALGLNIAWEFLYAAHGLATRIDVQVVINIAWALADVVIVYTFLRFGRAELPSFVTRPLFAGWAVLLFLTSFVVQWLFVVQFDWDNAARYAAFLQNLLMSGLFIAMFAVRRGLRGQSMLIAVAKWIGTLAPTISFGWYIHSPFILGIGLLCSIFDLAYIGLLWWARNSPRALAPAGNP
ncbi:transmembrane-type terpene cyclase [Arthrobacter cavernae]|uniref:Uncharacterized protein n=1 Tax=Arthrobacter cavernae TaxID=2817681 RepID=A0A939HCE7_9MICC|nr:hypothetical protein [Arthrobacter cavernae]MBO1268337.1 hypothetical protein [Arthrobacter cavernae]